MVDVAPPQPGDVEELAANLRDQDRAELDAAGHVDHEHAIRESVRVSVWSLSVRVNGELACVFGLASIGTMLAPRGAPWLLGTALVPKHRRILARLAPQYIAQMLEAFPHLLNQVHTKNVVSTGWLRKMGFVLQPPTPVPPYGELFHLFEMRA